MCKKELNCCTTKQKKNPPAEVRWHHAVHVNPVTKLQGYGHGEPASAEPRVGGFPEIKTKDENNMSGFITKP